jgi:hypothetical protein
MKGTFNKKGGQNPVWMLCESDENEEREQKQSKEGAAGEKRGRCHNGSGTLEETDVKNE